MIDEIRAWVDERRDWIMSHCSTCWKWHPECLAAILLKEIDEEKEEIKSLREALEETRRERDEWEDAHITNQTRRQYDA